MEHQLRTITGFVLCFLLALMSLALLVTAPVSAEEPSLAAANTSGGITGDVDHLPDLNITKTLIANQVTPMTAQNFSFTFTPVSINGIDETLPPALDTVSVSTSTTATFTQNGTSFYMSSAPVLSAAYLNSIQSTGAGYYYYTVKETQGNVTDMYYSQAQYTLILLVANKPDGSGVYIAGVMATHDKDDNGNAVSGTPKIDLSTGSGLNGHYNQFAFMNNYGPTSDLTISEQTVGQYANLGKPFTLSIKLTARPAITEMTTYWATLYNKDGSQAKRYSFSASIIGNSTTSKIETEPTEVTFTSGQKLVFTSLPVGTTYVISQAKANQYTTTGEIVYGGTSASIPSGTENPFLINSSSTGSHNVVMAGANTATVINTFNVSSPTGFIINNLPYVILAAAGIGILVYLSVKKRRHA